MACRSCLREPTAADGVRAGGGVLGRVASSWARPEDERGAVWGGSALLLPNQLNNDIVMEGYGLLRARSMRYFPMQNFEKITPNRSSDVNSPVISLRAVCASRSSSAIRSRWEAAPCR